MTTTPTTIATVRMTPEAFIAEFGIDHAKAQGRGVCHNDGSDTIEIYDADLAARIESAGYDVEYIEAPTLENGLMASANATPTLIVIEDLEWIDAEGQIIDAPTGYCKHDYLLAPDEDTGLTQYLGADCDGIGLARRDADSLRLIPLVSGERYAITTTEVA